MLRTAAIILEMDWRLRFERELTNAQAARLRGNEGRARVCARRAAGIVAAEYLDRLGTTLRTRSALDLLQQLRADGRTPPSAQPSIANLVLPVDQEIKLPAGIDLLLEARRLRDELLPVSEGSS
jgi:hypothetical protein